MLQQPQAEASRMVIHRHFHCQTKSLRRIECPPLAAPFQTEGKPVPTQSDRVVNLAHMDRVLEIRPQDLQANVQSGVLRKELNRRAHPGMQTIIADAAAPISRYPGMILFSQERVDRFQVPG